MALESSLMSPGFNSFLLLRDDQNSKCVWGVLAVIKFIYLPPTYLHFTQDIENKCLLLTSSTSFVDLPFQEHQVIKASYGPKSIHIFIMSKSKGHHKQYHMRGQRGQSGAGRPRFGVFSKSAFTTCQSKSARRESKVGKMVQQQNLATRPAWQVGLLSPNFGQGTNLIPL
jgi:hypothetical protein